MTKICQDRVAIITGAGRGLGRAHALELARQGAKVIVNDLGGSSAGIGADKTPAEEAVQEILALGGEAVVNTDDVSDWEGAQKLVHQAISTFGWLDILVNNAGILRARRWGGSRGPGERVSVYHRGRHAQGYRSSDDL